MNDLAGEVGHETVRIFHREKLDSDICIVLFHKGNKTKSGASPLGLHLVTALKEIGLVHHTTWIEIE